MKKLIGFAVGMTVALSVMAGPDRLGTITFSGVTTNTTSITTNTIRGVNGYFSAIDIDVSTLNSAMTATCSVQVIRKANNATGNKYTIYTNDITADTFHFPLFATTTYSGGVTNGSVQFPLVGDDLEVWAWAPGFNTGITAVVRLYIDKQK